MRWRKVLVDLHDEKDNWDISKVGGLFFLFYITCLDVYDCVKFDVIHMNDIFKNLSVPTDDLVANSRCLSQFYSTQEYGFLNKIFLEHLNFLKGINREEKFEIGRLIGGFIFKLIFISSL
jgi:hypothetical protein